MRKQTWLFLGLAALVTTLSVAFLPAEVQAQRDDASSLPAGNQTQSQAVIPPENSSEPKPIVVEEITELLCERLSRNITLDVRDMSIVDIVRFLAMKGNINLVVAGNIQGRATFYLKSVSIQDALDIAVLSSGLAYVIENDIIRVMSGADYEAVYGKKFNDRNIVKIVQLKYAKPSYVLAALDNIKSALGRIIIDEDTGSVVMIDTPESVSEMSEAIAEMEAPLETVVFPLQYAKADVVAEKIRDSVEGSKVGTVSIDERGNRIIVRAYPGRREELEAIIRSVDTPTKEVLVEARVLQIIFHPQMDFGIDWQLDFHKSDYLALNRINFDNIFLDRDNLTSSDNLYSNYGQFGVGDIDVNSFEMAIRALKQVSDTKVLSNPKILVTNNEEAKIHIGDTIPYIISTTSGTGESAITSEEVEFVDVGLKLNVTPTINDDGFVTMTLKPEISTVTGSVESQGGGIPKVNKTLVETTVMVKDGMTIVIGGLKKENKVHTVRGIPVLMNIPFVKRLFSSTSESIELTEIVIFLTPHIVSGEEDILKDRALLKAAQEYGGQEQGLNAALKLKE